MKNEICFWGFLVEIWMNLYIFMKQKWDVETAAAVISNAPLKSALAFMSKIQSSQPIAFNSAVATATQPRNELLAALQFEIT